MADNKSKSTEVGALWKRVAKNSGKTYLAGHIATEDLGAMALEKKVKIVVFSNNKEGQSENAPDFRMYLSRPPEQRKEEAPVGAPQPAAEAVSASPQDGDLI